jgi:transposase
MSAPTPLRHRWRESGYNGKGQGNEGMEQTLGWSAEIVAPRRRPSTVGIFDARPDDQIDWSQERPPPGLRVLARRWVVARTFAWQSQHRRLSQDYERLCATSEALIYVTMICHDASPHASPSRSLLNGFSDSF